MGSILYAREVPDFGGDTLFASMYLAYETLSVGMQQMLSGLKAVHSARRPYGAGGVAGLLEVRRAIEETGRWFH